MISDDNGSSYGKELLVFDRSGAPELVLDINPSGDGFNHSEDNTKAVGEGWDPTMFNDKLYFVANDGSGTDLWVYDGLTDPTKAFDFATTSLYHLTSLTVLDDTLYFLGDSGGASSTTGSVDLWSVG